MSSEEIIENYGWESHKYGFFDEWRDGVNRRLNLTPHKTYDTAKLMANFAKEVFDELCIKYNVTI